MSNLISRYFNSFGSPKGSPARNKVASLIKAKRSLQKKGEGPNVRKALMGHIGNKMVARRKAAASAAIADTASKTRRLNRTQHTITLGAQLGKKRAKYAAQKTKSVMASAGGRKPRGRKADLLKTHVNYA